MISWHLEKADIVKWKDKSNFGINNENQVVISLDPPELFSHRNKFRLFLFWKVLIKSPTLEEDLLDLKFENIIELPDIAGFSLADCTQLITESSKLLQQQFNYKKSGTNFEMLHLALSVKEIKEAAEMLKSKFDNSYSSLPIIK